jgi:hypothetical protein
VIAVLVPVLDRPDRAGPLVESILASSTLVDEIVFLCSPDDVAQQRAAARTVARVVVVPFDLAGGDYARKINHGVTVTKSPWLLQAGDDLRFHPGWDTAALAKDTGPHVGVIGTNDLGNPLVRQGRHSTHSLIRRTYIEELGTIDEPGKALHEGYWHCWVDNELVETAKHRRAYYAAGRSVVEHLHHIWPDGQGGRKGTDDATYRRGQKQYGLDARLFKRRRPLWR